MKAPERACRLQLDIQADTRDEMVRALEGIATAIDRGEMTTGCSGGVHSGWTYEYVERARPTHQEYHEQLKVYLAAKRAGMETPADLVGALQDKVHTDSGPFRAGRAAKETVPARPCVWRDGCKNPSVCDKQGVCVPGGEETP